MTTSGNIMLSEAQVTQQICDFMAWEKWRAHRLHPGKFVPYAKAKLAVEKALVWSPTREAELLRRIWMELNRLLRPVELEEAGEPDWLFVSSHYGSLYVEMKAEGEKPKPHQRERLAELNGLGLPATWTDGLDRFKPWYLKTYKGAQRNG